MQTARSKGGCLDVAKKTSNQLLKPTHSQQRCPCPSRRVQAGCSRSTPAACPESTRRGLAGHRRSSFPETQASIEPHKASCVERPDSPTTSRLCSNREVLPTQLFFPDPRSPHRSFLPPSACSDFTRAGEEASRATTVAGESLELDSPGSRGHNKMRRRECSRNETRAAPRAA